MNNWREVSDFWFGLKPAQWFRKDEAVDARLREKFGAWLEHFDAHSYEAWKTEPDSLLALVILLDQFPRNIYRGSARSFAFDPYALEAAREAFEKDFDAQLPPERASFLILPFEHSEDITDQKESVRLAKDLMERGGSRGTYDYAVRHHDIVARFGRFPHRNAILGRPSTPEELEFLKTPGSSF